MRTVRFSMHLCARLATDDGLQFAHQIRIGMRAQRRAQTVERVLEGSDTQSRKASSMAARSVRSPLVTGTTVVPISRMRPTFGAWRAMSTSPMYTVHGKTDARAGSSGGHAMLTGAGLGHHTLRAHAACAISA